MRTPLLIILILVGISCNTSTEVTSYVIPEAQSLAESIIPPEAKAMQEAFGSYYEGAIKIISPEGEGSIAGIDEDGDGTYEQFFWVQSNEEMGLENSMNKGQLLFMGASFIVNDMESDQVYFFSIGIEDCTFRLKCPVHSGLN